ncbi:hypothetical protein PVK06_007856 [Gossypium arboreum]|uniref:Uncharacterized protein n=1 Tax=Gossypium arboreum TaxID=29729 RepID=A0ABR0QIF9_GOSAR|nr:hypothetical protein PVK06_007856 [Gossypium arboreum]
MRYGRIFKKQQMLLDKGFTLRESNHTNFMAYIQKITKHRIKKCFVTSSTATEVIVRGVKVPFNLKTINNLFDLPNFEDNNYSTVMKNVEKEILQEILQTLTILGSKWTVSRYRSHTCCRENLTPLAKQFYVMEENLVLKAL